VPEFAGKRNPTAIEGDGNSKDKSETTPVRRIHPKDTPARTITVRTWKNG
jgi:hypothetical protein